MNAVAIGPLVFAPDRFAAILAIAAFLFLSEILARKVDRRFSSWAWGATLAFIAGAPACPRPSSSPATERCNPCIWARFCTRRC